MTDNLEPIGGDFQLASREAWLDLVDKVLKGGSFARLVSKTADGLTIDPLTTRPATRTLCPARSAGRLRQAIAGIFVSATPSPTPSSAMRPSWMTWKEG